MTAQKASLREESIYVYGSGTMAQRVANLIRQHFGAEVRFLELSREQASGTTPYVLVEETDLRGSTVVVGVHNEFFREAPVIDILKALGSRVIPFVGFIRELADRGIGFTNYMLTSDLGEREVARNQLSMLSDYSSDDHSLELLEGFISYVCDLTFVDYEPDSIPRNLLLDRAQDETPSDVVDVGAFEGGLLDAIDFRPDYYVAFEPNQDNFQKLVKKLKSSGINALALPLGLGKSLGSSDLELSGSSASIRETKAGASGETVVAKLDDVLHHSRVDVIRMDIEGSEVDALRGSREIILEHKPDLQIAAYHFPTQLVDVMQVLVALGVYKNFSLRTHRNAFFDTFVYCSVEG